MMKTAIASIGYPKQLDLCNTSTRSTYHLRLKEVAQVEREVLIGKAPGSHVLLDQPFSCTVCEAGAVLGLTVEILEPKTPAYLKKCEDARLSFTLDGEDIVKNERLKNGVPIQGKDLLCPVAIYEARIPKGDRVGVFIPNSVVLGAKISGLPKTKAPIKVAVTLDMALYTTRA